MKLCPWCSIEYPVEFFEDHHKNHIHEDNSEGNVINICVKCHRRHHIESGYDTVILKKDTVKPRTLEDLMLDIDRDEFLKEYREYKGKIFQSLFGSIRRDGFISSVKSDGDKKLMDFTHLEHSWVKTIPENSKE